MWGEQGGQGNYIQVLCVCSLQAMNCSMANLGQLVMPRVVTNV